MKQLSPLLFYLASCGMETIPKPAYAPTTQPSALFFQPKKEEPTAHKEPEGRWVAGDLHCHVSPPDNPSRITIDVDGVVELAQEKGLSFVILVPHLWGGDWRSSRGSFLQKYKKFVEVARSEEGVVLIPGVEYGFGLGHFNLSGFDLSSAAGHSDLLNAARSEEAFITVNHPLATNVTGFDMSYKPWTKGREGFSDFDAVEIWNARLEGDSPSSEESQAVEDALVLEADQLARQHKRHVSLVGGSDNHSSLLVATTWVYTKELTESAILEALREGRTCVGGPEAGSFTAQGDLDDKESWAHIGDTVSASKQVTLRFDGEARVYADGEYQGTFANSFLAKADQQPHTYQIEIRDSRSGFIYANF